MINKLKQILKGRKSIQDKLGAYFAIILIIAFIINSYLAHAVCEEILEKKVAKDLEYLVVDEAKNVEMTLKQKKEMIQLAVESIGFMDEDLAGEEVKSYLQVMKNTLSFQDLAYTDLAGNCYSASGKQLHISISEEYEQAKTGQLVVTANLEVNDERVISIASPIRNKDNNITGVLFGIESMKSFENLMENSGLSDEFIIINEHSQIIASSDLRIIQNSVDVKEGKKEEDFYEVLELYYKAKDGKTGTANYRSYITGKDTFISFAPIAENLWIGLLKYKEDELLIIKYFDYLMIVMTTITTIISVLIVKWLVKGVSKGMKDITNNLDLLGHGEFETPISEKLLALDDELGDTARALNHVKGEMSDMLATIKDCTDYMNNQMEDLTNEIKEAIKTRLQNEGLEIQEIKEMAERIENISQIHDYMKTSGRSEKPKL